MYMYRDGMPGLYFYIYLLVPWMVTTRRLVVSR